MMEWMRRAEEGAKKGTTRARLLGREVAVRKRV